MAFGDGRFGTLRHANLYPPPLSLVSFPRSHPSTRLHPTHINSRTIRTHTHTHTHIAASPQSRLGAFYKNVPMREYKFLMNNQV